MNGMMAAHLILQAGRGCAAETAVAAFYNDWVDRWFRHDLSTLRDLYRIFAWWPSSSP
jgi:hypothetical protein